MNTIHATFTYRRVADITGTIKLIAVNNVEAGWRVVPKHCLYHLCHSSQVRSSPIKWVTMLSMKCSASPRMDLLVTVWLVVRRLLSTLRLARTLLYLSP